LFGLIFLPGLARGSAPAAAAAIDLAGTFARVLGFNLPGLAMVLILSSRDARSAESGWPKPIAADLVTAAAAAAGLVALAAAIAALAGLFPETAAPSVLAAPSNAAEWAAVAALCLSTGYLEEGYFRAYLRQRFTDFGAGEPVAALASGFLFALCHGYEGIWGLANAAGASVLLWIAYRRRGSVHAPAWAHAAYNLLVYSRLL
jgi:membrane protease YdiL (CAAX protease family)